MRLARLITWICTALLAGISALYGAIVLSLLLDGRMTEFSKVPTGRSYTWADSPGLVIVSTFGHAVLLVFLVMLTAWTWRTLPTALLRLRGVWGVMTDFQRAGLCSISLALISTFAAMTFGLPAGAMRRPAIALIWVIWLGACAQIPLWALKLGEIRTATGKVLRRAHGPADFWRRWVVVTAWCALILALATLVCWIEW
jgi:hypothetical protein